MVNARVQTNLVEQGYPRFPCWLIQLLQCRTDVARSDHVHSVCDALPCYPWMQLEWHITDDEVVTRNEGGETVIRGDVD
jgi:hypothetical protein